MIKTLRRLVIFIFALHAFSPAHAAQAPGPTTQANQGPICSGSMHSWSVPPAAEPPRATPLITIVCGVCSDGTCPGKNITATCFDNFGTAGHCGAEASRCSDSHFFCSCEPDEPQPLLPELSAGDSKPASH